MNHQRWLSQNFFIFFITWGVFLPYWTGWLVQAKGLSVQEASLIMGFGLVARGISTLFAFPLASKFWSSQRVILILTIGSLIATILYLPATSFTMLFAVTILFSAIYPSLLPAVESTAGALMQQKNVHYGKSRSFGSIGYTIALLLIGAATAIWAEQAILYIMIVGLTIATLFFMRPAPEALRLKPVQNEKTKQAINFKSLFTSKGFAVVLLLAILLQGAHASYYNFGFIFLDNLGVNGLYIGIILNIAVLFEILFFTRADRLLSKVKVSTMFLIAGIGSTARWILIALFPYISVFVGTQLLHALSFGVAHFAFIKFISQKLPNDQIPTAQGMYAAFAMSLSTAILTFLGGYLYDISPQLAFLGMVICSIPAIIIVLMTRKKYAY